MTMPRPLPVVIRRCADGKLRAWALAFLSSMACLLFAGAILAGTESRAQSKPPEETAQDEARSAFLREGIKPFSEIMTIARSRVAGDFVKIELKRKKHGWEYKVRILTPEGRRTEMKINAVSGEILEID
jgi:uncharacterized membrane protein YkoI